MGRPKSSLYGVRCGPYSPYHPTLNRRLKISGFRGWRHAYPDRIDWPKYKEENHPLWELRRDAQFAMVVMRNTYLIFEDKSGTRPFNEQAMLFWSWLTELAETNTRRSGMRRDLLSTWKTALALIVARAIVARDRHYTKPPSDREIAEAWYLLFGEHESRNKIKSRLPKVARFCYVFAKDETRGSTGGKREEFRKAGEAILKHGPESCRCDPQEAHLGLSA